MRSSIGETQIHPQESRSGVSGRSTAPRQAPAQYTTRLLTPDTWEDFAALVEANNGVWGAQAGGGLVEAYPEQVVGRHPQRGAYLHTGPESLFEEFGFVRDRRIAKWRWVMRLHISAWNCLLRLRT
jgi:hypothetical protein